VFDEVLVAMTTQVELRSGQAVGRPWVLLITSAVMGSFCKFGKKRRSCSARSTADDPMCDRNLGGLPEQAVPRRVGRVLGA